MKFKRCIEIVVTLSEWKKSDTILIHKKEANRWFLKDYCLTKRFIFLLKINLFHEISPVLNRVTISLISCYPSLMTCMSLWDWSLTRLPWYMLFFYISNTFVSNARLKWAKNQANVKQHPEAELCYLKIIHIFPTRYHPKIMGHILKSKQKNKCVCIHEIMQLMNRDKKSASWNDKLDLEV